MPFIWTLSIAAPVIDQRNEVTINWTEGVLEVRGVGRTSFDSSIARPSREAMFERAAGSLKTHLLRITAQLWQKTPFLSLQRKRLEAVIEHALVSNTPTYNLYADGSVHALLRVPMSRLDGVQMLQELRLDGSPIVVQVPDSFVPTLGIIFCLGDETKIVTQARITIHDDHRTLPTFLQTSDVLTADASIDSVFQCLRFAESFSSGESWSRLDGARHVYVVRKEAPFAL